MKQIVAFSGGKDSTALALRLAEQGEEFELLFTATGDELPELMIHIQHVVTLTGRKLVTPPNQTLAFWTKEFNALPNWRQRWCTRLIKIKPCIAYLEANPGSTLIVGLRADEPEREGLYGPYATYRYPLREWGWGIKEVLGYLRKRDVRVPKRTDCARCYGQRLIEWYELWLYNRPIYLDAENDEDVTGFTYRSPGRDTQPASLKELRIKFENGYVPRGVALPSLFDEDEEDETQACRVCRL